MVLLCTINQSYVIPNKIGLSSEYWIKKFLFSDDFPVTKPAQALVSVVQEGNSPAQSTVNSHSGLSALWDEVPNRSNTDWVSLRNMSHITHYQCIEAFKPVWTEIWFMMHNILLGSWCMCSQGHYIKSLFYSVVSVHQIPSQYYPNSLTDLSEIAEVEKIYLKVKCAGKITEVGIFPQEKISVLLKEVCDMAGKKPEIMTLVYEGKHSIRQLFLEVDLMHQT